MVLYHRMAGILLLGVVLSFVLVSAGCDYAGKAGASGQTSATGQTEQTVPRPRPASSSRRS